MNREKWFDTDFVSQWSLRQKHDLTIARNWLEFLDSTDQQLQVADGYMLV